MAPPPTRSRRRSCPSAAPPSRRRARRAPARRASATRFACRGRPLVASDVLHLPWQRQGVMVTARWQDGSTARRFFARGAAGIEVPLAALRAGSGSLADAARRYLALGVEHILLGIDHLLFVLGLLLIVRGPWPLLKTITAFTLAHSLTLALATFGVVTLPPRPVDAAIALSIVFLAAEILRGRQGRHRAHPSLPLAGRVRLRPAAWPGVCRRARRGRAAGGGGPARHCCSSISASRSAS